MRRAPLPKIFSRDVSSIHCVGIGGMGMGPLAIYLAQLGFKVSGEDDAMTDAMRHHLEREKIALTSAGDIPEPCELLVCSSAISSQHPARIAAGKKISRWFAAANFWLRSCAIKNWSLSVAPMEKRRLVRC